MRKRKGVLLLARSDMQQAAAAARKLETEAYDRPLMLALETAIAVCYSRPFSTSTLLRLNEAEYVPDDPALAELHRKLLERRDKAYAHTDEDNGRAADIRVERGSANGPLDGLQGVWEEWLAFPRSAIPAVLGLFNVQAQRFLKEALAIQNQLDATTD